MRGLAKSGEKKVDWREFRATAAACKEAAKAAGVTVQRETPPVPLDDAERWRLDQAVAAFRLGSAAADGVQSWVRTMRRATGITAAELARRMGVAQREIWRVEKIEQEGRIGIPKLKAAAEALDCELVYALVPVRGSLALLAELAKMQQEERLEAQEEKRRKTWREQGWEKAMAKVLRRTMRQAGIRLK